MSAAEPQRPSTPWAAPDLPALTSVRFFAAFVVVLFHSAEPLLAWGRSVGAGLFFVPIGWAFRWGYLGVSFFFVLSGFILTHVYAGAPEPGPVDRRRFWVARIARVYPVYLVGMIGCAPFVILGSLNRYDSVGAVGHVALSAVPALLLVHGWISAWVPLWNYPSWSVAAEAFFYLLFPWVVPPLVRATRRNPFATGIGVWLVGMSLPVVYVCLMPGGQSSTLPWVRFVDDVPLFHVHQFLLGIVAGRFYVDHRTRLKGDALTMGGLLLLAVGLASTTSLPVPCLHDGLLAPAFALIILGLAVGGRLARLLSAPFLMTLGAASYTLYILQNPIADGLAVLFAATRPDLAETLGGQAVTAAATILIMVAVSILVTNRIEEPARRWILKRFGSRRPAIAPAPVVMVG